MTAKNLSSAALSVIDRYLRFKFGSAVCSVPYFNNKKTRTRVGLRAYIGKGSPEEIQDELKALAVKQHISPDSLSNESLKKILVDNNIGIECSGFAYYVLGAEGRARGQGALDKHLKFVHAQGLLGKLRAAMRPAENCDVATLANDSNSHVVALRDIQPGDMITMLGGPEGEERDHVLVVHEVESNNGAPQVIHYSHAVAYPEDGVYGSGVRQGTIEITDANMSVNDGLWSENSAVKSAEVLFNRVQKSKTEIRRLNWF